MANIRKSFNFRNGVQVDDDNFVVNANGLVGIGTSIPTEAIDAIGNAKISGFTSTGTLGVAETANFYDDVNVGSNISFDPTTGTINAANFVGDASQLTGIAAISTSGWISQGVGLHTIARSVGIGTNNPLYKLQIESDPATGVGIGMTSGNILASGIVTATSFVGGLTGDVTGNVTGDLTGNVTGNVTGDLTGVAASSTKLETARNFEITGDLEAFQISFDGTDNVSLASTLSSSFSADTSGIITASKFVGPTESSTSTITQANITYADVGVGTFDGIRVNTISDTEINVTGDTTASVSVGKSVGTGNQSAVIKYTPSTAGLDISNYDYGDVSVLLHEGTGAGSTGGFRVVHDNNTVINANYDGRVAINKASPDTGYNLDVNGDVKVSGIVSTGEYITIRAGQANEVTVPDANGFFPAQLNSNANINTGVSTFNSIAIGNTILSSATPASTIGIGLTEPGGDSVVAISTNSVIANADVEISSGFGVTVETATIQNLTVSSTVSLPSNFDAILGVTTTNDTVNVGGGLTVTGGRVYVGSGSTVELTGSLNVFDGGFVFGLSTNTVASNPDLQNFEVFKTDPEKSNIGVSSDALHLTHNSVIGIGTTTHPYGTTTDVVISGTTVLQDKTSFLDNTAFGTNNFREDPRGEGQYFSDYNAPDFDYGQFQVHSNGNVTFVNDGATIFVPSLGQSSVGFGTTNGGIVFDTSGDNMAAVSIIGINTFFPRCLLDVGYASTAANSYFLPPVVTESELNIIRLLPDSPNNLGYQQSIESTPDGVPSGALVYNSTNTRLEVGIGTTTFCGIATLSNNHTGYSAFVPPRMTTANRNTMTNAGLEAGAVIYNTSTNKLQVYNGSSWETISSS